MGEAINSNQIKFIYSYIHTLHSKYSDTHEFIYEKVGQRSLEAYLAGRPKKKEK